MHNLIKRFKVCWNVLTKTNYVYFGIGKNPFIWDENGYYSAIEHGKLAESVMKTKLLHKICRQPHHHF